MVKSLCDFCELFLGNENSTDKNFFTNAWLVVEEVSVLGTKTSQNLGRLTKILSRNLLPRQNGMKSQKFHTNVIITAGSTHTHTHTHARTHTNTHKHTHTEG